MSAALSIRNFTHRRMPALPFARAARAVLPGWDVSLALVGARRAKRLNETLRGKTYVPNVLAYEVGEKTGEIILCPDTFEKQAPAYGLEPSAYCLLLFIHALLHLKGERHGLTMERKERALVARFIRVSRHPRTDAPKNRNRHRYRHRPDQGRRGRGGAGS